MIRPLYVIAASTILLLAACNKKSAHGDGEHGGHGHEHEGHGHAHGEDESEEHAHGQAEPEDEGHGHGHGEGNLKLTLFDSGHELFVEIEPLAAGKESTYTAHVTRLRDNHPAVEGTLTVRFSKGGKVHSETVAKAPDRRGIFEFPAPSPTDPGTYVLEMDYAGHGDSATWRSKEEVPVEPHPAGDDSDGEDLSFTKEQQWDIPFRQELVIKRAVGKTFTVAATIAADPRRSRAILSPAAGYFQWSESFQGRGIGARVIEGQQLAVLRPEVPTEHWSRLEEDVSLAKISLESAKEELKRVLSLAGRGLTQAKEVPAAEALVKKAEVEERRARKERTRVDKLVKDGLLPGQRLITAESAQAEARIDREGAEAELARLKQLVSTRLLEGEDRIAAQAAVDKAQAAYDASLNRLEEKKGTSERELPIVAPLAGVVTEVFTSHGHQVSLGSPVAHIVSDETVLLQVEVSMFDLESLDEVEQLWLQRPGDEMQRSFSDLDVKRVTDALVFDPARLTATISYRLKNDASFRIGEFIQVQIMLKAEEELPVVRRSAIVEINTIPYVFVALSGEGYARRRVTPGQSFGDLVAIRSGLLKGDWAVTEGGFDLYVTSLTGSLQSHQH
jgi:biotin carboxyl carrier protein